MSTITLKNVGLCNLRINFDGRRYALAAFGAPVEVPAEAEKLSFVQERLKSGALVKVSAERKTASKPKAAKAEAEKPEA